MLLRYYLFNNIVAGHLSVDGSDTTMSNLV